MKADRGDQAGFFDALMDAAVDAIIIIDQRGAIQRFNRSAQLMFGYGEEEVVQRNVCLLMPEPAHSGHDGYLARYLETGQAAIIGKGRVERGKRKSGEIFPMRLSVGECRMNDEVHFVGIIHDLSKQVATEEKLKDMEQQLLHAERLLTLGELTAGIAHEINQPLTAIAAYADAARHLVAKSGDVTDAAVDDIFDRISKQSRRAGEVVDRLRKLVRSGTTRKSRHDIRTIVANTLVLFDFDTKKTGIEIRVLAPESLPPVFVDEIQIQQILVNLVKNAMDAIQESAGTEPAPKRGRVDIDIRVEQGELWVAVRDNGAGVGADSLPHLFEPFYSSKPKGVGLGLSICKHIAVAHGGNLVHVPDSRPGCCFVLKLPLSSIG